MKLSTEGRWKGFGGLQMKRRAGNGFSWVTAGIVVIAAAGVFQSPARAQDQQSQDQQSTKLQTVTVTGSMIKRVDAETSEAVTILKADALKAQGITSVEQVISTLTASNPDTKIVTAVGTFSGGGTYANLRGLGDGRTLVLLDGQRLAPNAYSGNAVDLAGIPFSAIDRVEVLREGASALYGTDAIAGVINFITKKSYHGGEVQVNLDVPQKAGGSSGTADITLGLGNLWKDGYNVLGTVSYSKQRELQASQRGFSAEGFDPADGITGTNFPGNAPGIYIDGNGSYWQYGYPTCAGNPYLTRANGDCAYRYSAATDLLPESHNISGMLQFTKTLPFNNQLKAQYFVAQSELNAYAGPIEYLFGLDTKSPYYPTAASPLTCDPNTGVPCAATPNFSSGSVFYTDPDNARYSGNVNTEQRLLLTFSGSNAGWDYSTDLNLSKNLNDNRLTGGYPNEAVLAPGNVLSDLVNPFGPQTAAGQAFINSTYVNGTYQQGSYTRWSLDGTATHALGDAFNAGTPATLALGASVSGERFTNATTPLNDLVSAATFQNDVAVSGVRQVQAVFMELDVPMSKKLDFDISDRQDRYSDFGLTNNGKVQLLYHATDFLTVRGTASTGFRAPTLYDLYLPDYVGATGGAQGNGNPFCTPATYNAEFNAASCASQGIQLIGGNKNLTPETSKNFDLGIVLSPTADLGITLDYFHILVKNTIGGVPYSAIFGNPSAFSSYIVTATSGPFAGQIPSAAAASAVCVPSYTASTCGYVIQTNANTGFLSTSGMDLSVQYQQHTEIGTFREDLEGTLVTLYKQQLYTGGPTKNLLDNLAIANQNPAFRWQHNVSVNWTSPGKMWGGGLSERYYSGYDDQFPNAAGVIPHVGSYSLVDGYASVKPVEKLTVLFGIKNIFNTSPPLTNATQGNFAAGYNALIADPLLRNFYLNLKYSL
ncbi:MAG: TonB-dependent receptor domain-containing protein [Stenotrophobium sp.]